MNKKFLIDVGSSTVKVYEKIGNSISLFFARSLPFKKDFDPGRGLSDVNQEELFELIRGVKEKNPNVPIKLFATALFRKLDSKARKLWIDEFFIRTGLYFNIIPQDLESFYLQVALVGKYQTNEPVLLVNIGGGSIELIVMYGKEVVEIKNIDLGVGTLLATYPDINNQKTSVPLREIIQFVSDKLPVLDNKVKVALYSGGELTYMRLVPYHLQENILFQDADHPSIISVKDFSAKNKKLFEQISVEQLEKLMPENPTWMHGARACSALAQAIFEKYRIETVVPSDSNLINGAARQEFRRVTISGSFRKHLEYILKIRHRLIEMGIEVLSPRFIAPQNPGDEFVIFSGEEGMSPLELERHHLHAIEQSDALVVCDPAGYVGASALIEIGYAQALGKRIIFMERPEEFMLNTLPCEIGL